MGVRTGAGAGVQGAGGPGGASALTLSASSGTRCCTRSSTYMLECGRGLRQTQDGLCTRPGDHVVGDSPQWDVHNSGAGQTEQRGVGGLRWPPTPACTPGPCPHHTESEKRDGGHARSQLTPTLGPCTCPLTPPPRARRAGRGRAAPRSHPDHPSALASQGSRGRKDGAAAGSPPPAAVPTGEPAEVGRARAPAMATGPQDDHAARLMHGLSSLVPGALCELRPGGKKQVPMAGVSVSGPGAGVTLATVSCPRAPAAPGQQCN